MCIRDSLNAPGMGGGHHFGHFNDPPPVQPVKHVLVAEVAQVVREPVRLQGQAAQEGGLARACLLYTSSVVRVFGGQPYLSGVTYVRDLGKREPKPATSPKEEQLSMLPVQPQEPEDDTGYKNDTVRLTSEELLANIRAIQAENNIHQSERLVRDLGCCSLDVEMETGTGKTYVYIKTMFELNKRCLLYTS